jgi:hypothetical protein
MSKTIPKTVVRKINKKLVESLGNYQKMMGYMGADLPIESLCLSKKVEKVLINAGFLRIFELFDLDLFEIEGIDVIGARELTSSLNKFIAMS